MYILLHNYRVFASGYDQYYKITLCILFDRQPLIGIFCLAGGEKNKIKFAFRLKLGKYHLFWDKLFVLFFIFILFHFILFFFFGDIIKIFWYVRRKNNKTLYIHRKSVFSRLPYFTHIEGPCWPNNILRGA